MYASTSNNETYFGPNTKTTKVSDLARQLSGRPLVVAERITDAERVRALGSPSAGTVYIVKHPPQGQDAQTGDRFGTGVWVKY